MLICLYWLNDGYHKLKLKGSGCTEEREFYIGENYQGDTDATIYPKRLKRFVRISCVIAVILDLYIILPFPFNNNFINKLEHYIEGITPAATSAEEFKFYLGAIFLGPLLIKKRYYELNKKMRLFLLIFSLFPLILPQFPIQSYHGIGAAAFSFFIVVGKNFLPDPWALQFTGTFYFSFLFPFLLCITGHKFNNIILKVANYFWIIAHYLFIVFLVIRYQGESVYRQFLVVNPLFVILPGILLLIYRYYKKNNILYEPKDGGFQKITSFYKNPNEK